jgi:hypothetical protein
MAHRKAKGLRGKRIQQFSYLLSHSNTGTNRQPTARRPAQKVAVKRM